MQQYRDRGLMSLAHWPWHGLGSSRLPNNAVSTITVFIMVGSGSITV